MGGWIDGCIVSPVAALPASPQTSHLSQPTLPNCHAQLSFPDTVKAVERVTDYVTSGGPTTALTQVWGIFSPGITDRGG